MARKTQRPGWRIPYSDGRWNRQPSRKAAAERGLRCSGIQAELSDIDSAQPTSPPDEPRPQPTRSPMRGLTRSMRQLVSIRVDLHAPRPSPSALTRLFFARPDRPPIRCHASPEPDTVLDQTPRVVQEQSDSHTRTRQVRHFTGTNNRSRPTTEGGRRSEANRTPGPSLSERYPSQLFPGVFFSAQTAFAPPWLLGDEKNTDHRRCTSMRVSALANLDRTYIVRSLQLANQSPSRQKMRDQPPLPCLTTGRSCRVIKGWQWWAARHRAAAQRDRRPGHARQPR